MVVRFHVCSVTQKRYLSTFRNRNEAARFNRPRGLALSSGAWYDVNIAAFTITCHCMSVRMSVIRSSHTQCAAICVSDSLCYFIAYRHKLYLL